MVTVQYYYNIEERWIEVEVNEDVAEFLKLNNTRKKSQEIEDAKNSFQVDGNLIKNETPTQAEQDELNEFLSRQQLQKEILHIALRTITERQREVIACKFFDLSFRNQFGKRDEKPNPIVAQEMGTSRANVSKVLLAAYADLRDFFKSVRGGYALYEEYWGQKFTPEQVGVVI